MAPSCSLMLLFQCHTTQRSSDALLLSARRLNTAAHSTLHRHGYLRSKTRLMQNLPAFGTIPVSFLWVCYTSLAPTAQFNPSLKLEPRPPYGFKEHSMKDLDAPRPASHWGHEKISPAMGASGQWMQLIWSQWVQAKVEEEEKESKRDLPRNAWSTQSVATS